jgi:2-keto-4-pentenoate hydratase/2-oxohepta-3-ene-1,7-dioic acid hydratase in catechol pathway
MKTVKFRDADRQLSVGKILCLGRNYAEHAKEMGSEIPDAPIVFMKPATALINSGGNVVIPTISNEVHHEVEMVVAIGKLGRRIPKAIALDYVAGYGVGLDMTLRDVQSAAKKQGLPWTVAKGFDTSAPVSALAEKSTVPNPQALDIVLRVNGTVRQRSNTRHMIFPIDSVIAYLSSIFTLEPGDLIFTGTPEGVGAVAPGDVLEAELESVGKLTVSVVREHIV